MDFQTELDQLQQGYNPYSSGGEIPASVVRVIDALPVVGIFTWKYRVNCDRERQGRSGDNYTNEEKRNLRELVKIQGIEAAVVSALI